MTPGEQGQLILVEANNNDMRPIRAMYIKTDMTETGAAPGVYKGK